MRRGYDDIDATGAAITGLFAGQRIFGGVSANSNLTLSANAGDGVGAQTGYVQVTDNFRPSVDASLQLGLSTHQFLKGWFVEGQFGTMNIVGGSITDSSGAISFGNENLSTSGTVTSGTLLLGSGSITDSSGAISFGNENLTTTGSVTASHVVATTAASTFFTGTSIADFTFTNGNIASLSSAVNFNALDLTTTGFLTGARLDVDNVRVDGSTISITSVNGNLNVNANGTGTIVFGNNLSMGANTFTASGGTINFTGGSNLTVVGQSNFDDVTINGSTISANITNGGLILQPDGTGRVGVGSTLYPVTSAAYALGSSTELWTKLWVSNAIGNATTEITMADLLTLRSVTYRDSGRTQPAQAGDSLFFDGTQWLASVPDSEISHAGLSGLTSGDAGHSQFALLAGRAGGQSLIGGTASGENLNFESTSNVTKGFLS